jgi:hypothetical protein
MMPMGHYGITESRGFLPSPDPLDRLPERYAAWEDVAGNGSTLIMAGRLRRTVGLLPVLDPGPLADGRELERAMLLLTVLANAYVWGEGPGTDRLPPSLARPLHEVARRLDRPPIVAHASIVLNNWRRIDPARLPRPHDLAARRAGGRPTSGRGGPADPPLAAPGAAGRFNSGTAGRPSPPSPTSRCRTRCCTCAGPWTPTASGCGASSTCCGPTTPRSTPNWSPHYGPISTRSVTPAPPRRACICTPTRSGTGCAGSSS